MLLEKYSPTSTKEIIGNSSAVMEIRKFLASWKRGKALLVHGPTGSGKSTAIRLIAEELGYDLIENHPNEDRNVKNFLQASMQQGIFSKKKIMLFEDIDVPVRGFSQLIKASGHPVICTINDVYQVPASSRKDFKLVKFEKISEQELMRFLEDVCRKEGISCPKRDLEQLARMSNGDIRALLIDLEILMLGFKQGYRDVEENIFNTLRIIFKTMSIENSRIAMDSSEKDGEELFRWLEQNIIEEYTDADSIASAYDYLSKADIFYSRIIRRQSWGLQKYSSGLAVYGTALAKNRPSARFVNYRPPTFIRRDSGALEKIARQLHTSKKGALEYVPIIRMLLKKKSNIAEQFGLDEGEISLIIGKQ